MIVPNDTPREPPPNLDRLRAALSEQRFATYLGATGGDPARAWALYEWGLDAATAFQLPLHALEITLRNSLHTVIANVFGPEWLTTPGYLRHSEIRMVAEASSRLQRDHKPVTADALVAALSFGFWVGLVAAYHDQILWRRAGHRAFNSSPRRRDVHDQLDRVRTLRNRIAHHEHLLRRHLDEDNARIVGLLHALNPDIGEWVEQRSTVNDILARRPPN